MAICDETTKKEWTDDYCDDDEGFNYDKIVFLFQLNSHSS